MAYRRRQVMGRSYSELPPSLELDAAASSYSTSSSLAAQAIKASAAYRDPSHSSAYASKDHPKVEMLVGTDNHALRKRLDAFTSSINRIGDSIGNAIEEGCTIVESKTANLIEETRRLQLRRKGLNSEEQSFESGTLGSLNQSKKESPNQASRDDQLKAARDVAMATAAKAKLLLRELKTVRADLAFSKERCSQLEKENKILREAREKGVNPADDDMIRLQLETLLAEKARLANENAVYARENCFLREIVEYHQLTMQDVVYLDENNEEVTEIVYTLPAIDRSELSVSPPSPLSPHRPNEVLPTSLGQLLTDINISQQNSQTS